MMRCLLLPWEYEELLNGVVAGAGVDACHLIQAHSPIDPGQRNSEE